MKIEDLNLDVRTYNVVRRAGVTTVEELRQRMADDPDELRRGIGSGTFETVEEVLAGVQESAVILENPEAHARAYYLRDDTKARLSVIEENYYAVCKNMKEMRDGKLYKELGYQNFEDCCNTEFGLKRRQTYKYISIAENLSPDFVHSNAQIGTTKLSLLAMLDEPTREAVTETVDVENTTVKELKDEINKLKAEKSAVMAEKQNVMLALNRSQDETAQAQTELMNAQKEVEQLRQSNAELTEDNNYLIRRCAEAEEDLEEAQNAPIDYAVLEDTESKKELERVRGLMEKMSEGFSQKELAIEERVRKEYEEKLAAAQNGGDGRQVYKFLIENAMQSVARVKSFLKQHPDYAADKEKDFLDLISQNFFTVLEAMQDG